MHAAHGLLLAASNSGSIASAIGSGSIPTFLGTQWVEAIRESCQTLRSSKARNKQRTASGEKRTSAHVANHHRYHWRSAIHRVSTWLGFAIIEIGRH